MIKFFELHCEAKLAILLFTVDGNKKFRALVE
jgi:hypothetical protein